MHELGISRLTRILLQIDEEAYLTLSEPAFKPAVVIAGGSALMLSKLTKRPSTHDIDLLQYDGRLQKILKAYRMVNSSIVAYADQIPYNFEDRLILLEIGSKFIDYFVPSQEDLAVMKLYGWRPNDIEDLESPSFLDALNWSLLDKLVFSDDEARASSLSPRRYEEMATLYLSYARRHGHEPQL